MRAEIILTDTNINIDLNEPTIDVSTEDGISVTIIGGVGPQGGRGPEGPKGEKGDDYVLTEDDKDDIAGLAAEKVDLADYVKNTDYPKVNRMVAGVVKVDTAGGLYVDAGGLLSTYPASGAEIKEGAHNYRPIMPKRQHISTFYGLAKAAGVDEKDSELTFGAYTEAAKAAIRVMIGAVAPADIPVVPVQDVMIDGESILQDGVAIVPIANDLKPGVVKVPGDCGLNMTTAGNITLVPAPSSMIKAGEQNYYPIVPKKQHEAAFYGLAKAAGVDEKDSTLPGGQYTEKAKAAIRTMLDVPATGDVPEVPVQGVEINGTSITDQNGMANIPVASDSNFGVVKIQSLNNARLDGGITQINDVLYAVGAPASKIKYGRDLAGIVSAAHIDTAAFYGLSKAAGVDLAASEVTTGTYPDNAKIAIREMLGLDDASIVDIVQAGLPAVEGVLW